MSPRSAQPREIDRQAEPCRRSLHPLIEGHQGAAEERGESEILRIVGLRPAELVCDSPRLATEQTVTAFNDGSGLEQRERSVRNRLGHDAAPAGNVKSRARFRPEQRRPHELLTCEGLEAAVARRGGQNDVRVEDEDAQRESRTSRTRATQSGIGSPVHVVRHPSGMGVTPPRSRASARSLSSMTCCVPILLARSLPERIQRRIVSGFRPVRRAASGTVIIVVEYYYNMSLGHHVAREAE